MIATALTSRLAVLIPVAAVLMMAIYFRSVLFLPCPDDPLTAWHVIYADERCDIPCRSNLTLRMSTYFWLVQPIGRLAGLPGIRALSLLVTLATTISLFMLTRNVAPATLVPVVAATAFASEPVASAFSQCARPHVFLFLFSTLALWGLYGIHRRRCAAGLLTVASSVGLMAHMSLTTIPTAILFLGLAFPLSWRRGARITHCIASAAIAAILLQPAVAKVLPMARVVIAAAPSEATLELGDIGSDEERTRLWHQDVLPPVGQLFRVATIGAPLVIILFARRKEWLLRMEESVLSDRGLLILAGVGLFLPVGALALFFLTGTNLALPVYYPVGEIVLATFLGVALGSGTEPRRRARVASGALAFMFIYCWVIVPFAPRFLRDEGPWDRRAQFRYVATNGQPGDLVVVVSFWEGSVNASSYESSLLRSKLVADSLLVPDLRRLDILPAPVPNRGAFEPWRRIAGEAVERAPRIWFIDVRMYPLSYDSETWALGVLRDLGYREVDGVVPGELSRKVRLLERAHPIAVGSEDDSSTTSRAGCWGATVS